jgi:hypothetical protein
MGLAGVSENLVHGAVLRRHEPGTIAFSVAIATALLAGLFSSTLCAQTNAGSSNARSANRFLFIVETSRAMQPRAGGVFDAIKRALGSSLNGQIHQGDLVGLWTFNEVLYQELFPTQIWSQPTQLAFAVRLPAFADPELYQRRARLDKVVPEMLKIMARDENVTIILITAGEGVLEGTPFSAQISAAWKEWRDEQRDVHMPLQTVLRVINGKATDWLMTPAPRPIELPQLTLAAKQLGETQGKPAPVVLESGLATNQPTALATEQQIAFSVWALGKTGLMASATSPRDSAAPQSRPEDSASLAADSATNMPKTPANTAMPQPELSKTATVIAATEEHTQSAAPVAAATEGQERQAGDTRTVTSISNAPPPDNAKPVELVFVTNAPAQPSAAETQLRSNVPTPTQSPVSAPTPAAASTADVPGNDHLLLLAHARAAVPSPEEKRDLGPAMATPPRGFLRDNINPLALMIVAGVGAFYCFKMWLRSNVRRKGNIFSLTRPEPGEQVAQEP